MLRSSWNVFHLQKIVKNSVMTIKESVNLELFSGKLNFGIATKKDQQDPEIVPQKEWQKPKIWNYSFQNIEEYGSGDGMDWTGGPYLFPT